MLTEDQIAQYHRNGYVIPDYRIDSYTINAIKAAHERLLKNHPEFHDYCGALLVYDLGFLNYARNPDILDMVEQLIGPNIALWNSSLFAKPARVGTRTPWHQDGEYWPIKPLATCSVWIALDDSTIENGCLKFLPGSHGKKELEAHHFNNADGLSLPLELDKKFIDETKAVDIVLEAGQISLHDVFLMHASEPNRSDKPRRAMTLRFMPTTSVYHHHSKEDLSINAALSTTNKQRSVFLIRGQDVSGKNDFRVR